MTGTWGHGGTRCRISVGFEGAGREGDAVSYFDHDRLGQTWAVVLWDDEDDPECFKADGLLIRRLDSREFLPFDKA